MYHQWVKRGTLYKAYDSGMAKEIFTEAISIIHKLPVSTLLVGRVKEYHYSTGRFQFLFFFLQKTLEKFISFSQMGKKLQQ